MVNSPSSRVTLSLAAGVRIGFNATYRVEVRVIDGARPFAVWNSKVIAETAPVRFLTAKGSAVLETFPCVLDKVINTVEHATAFRKDINAKTHSQEAVKALQDTHEAPPYSGQDGDAARPKEANNETSFNNN